MKEQWLGDWMHDADTGQLIDTPVLNRYEMFMEIRRLREQVRILTESIKERARIEAATRAFEDSPSSLPAISVLDMRTKWTRSRPSRRVSVQKDRTD